MEQAKLNRLNEAGEYREVERSIPNIVVDFIRAKRINSFQKLYVLLFLYQYPQLVGTSQQLANQLYLGYLPLVEKILNDLRGVGLVDGIGRRYKLCDDPKAGSGLYSLAEAVKDPLTRQKILEQVRSGISGYQAEWSGMSCGHHCRANTDKGIRLNPTQKSAFC